MTDVKEMAKQKREEYDKKLKEETVLPECFLGHILIESQLDDVEEYLKQRAGLSKDSIIALPQELIEAKYDSPSRKGKIVKKAPDTFGKWFKEQYGDIGYLPVVGDVVIYLAPTATYIDVDRKYALIPETSIKGYIKGE